MIIDYSLSDHKQAGLVLSAPMRALVIAFMLFAASGSGYAATNYYVWKDNPSPSTPFTNWAMAATNIQAAVNLTLAGDTVIVSNGTYDTGGTITPGSTVTNRVCVTTAITLRSVNGAAVTIIKGSGAVQPYCRCVYMTNAATLTGFTITNGYSSLYGGGIECYGGVVSNCVILGNTASNYGGGVYLAAWSAMYGCLVVGNRSVETAGGVSIAQSSMNNCTVVSNTANYGGGVYITSDNDYMRNCIIWGNSSNNVYNVADYTSTGTNIYNCTDPQLTGAGTGPGNIGANPMFADTNAANYRLSNNSPCINTGTNQDWMTNSVDLDGLSRLVQGTVDMGAYESEYYFSLSPAAFTNTVMRGSATNLSVFLVNSVFSNTQLYWQAVNTSAWVSLGAATMIETNSTNQVVITNNTLGLPPITYYSRMTIAPTNITLEPLAHYYYPQTGTVDMTLHVAEFTRSPTQLTPTVRQGGVTNGTVNIWNSGAGNLSYSVYTNVSWLAVSPASGVLTGQTAGATNTLTVLFTNTPLPVGTYYGALTLAPSGIVGPSLEINVELTVTTGPQMVVHPLILTDAVMMGQNYASQTMRVSNGSSTEQIGYGVTKDSAWLTLSSTNGVLSPQTTNELVISYQTSTLTTNSSGGPSNYNATITVTATNSDVLGSPAEASVTMTVNPRARLNLSASSLTNIITEGYDASDCAFEIWNGNGYYTLNYALSDNADWFVLNPSSGTSTGEHDVITVEFSTAGFTTGVSNALITVVGRAYDGTHLDSAIDATQTVAVSVMVIPVAELATDASATYEFSARFGHSAGSASFGVWNGSGGGSVLEYTIATNASWLTTRPVPGTSAGEKNTITLSCNTGNLRPGRYSGALTISGIDRSTGGEARNSPANVNVELTIIGDKGFDFGGDGDGASDLIVYQESGGLWNITNLFSGYTTSVVFGGKGYVPVPGDYDGDMISDLGNYRYSSGHWYLRKISDQYLTVFGGSYWAGPELASLGGYVSVAGDYDGDGLTDPAMYCERSGLWSGLFSGSGYAYISGVLGGPGYAAVPADYDGDGKTDPAVYNETTAEWCLLYSGDNYRVITGLFGGPGFTAAPADYDGDGKADGCIYKEATGLWIILPSSTLSSHGYAPFTDVFGGPGFKPVPADYNGDGLADLCVYDEVTGNWYIVSLDGTRIAWPARHGGYGFAPVKP